MHVYSALNAGSLRVSALVMWGGNEFQEEIVLGTNECKQQLGWANGWKNTLDRHLLGWGTKTDEGKKMRLCTILNIVQSLWCSQRDWRLGTLKLDKGLS